jgi:hypothetical protein
MKIPFADYIVVGLAIVLLGALGVLWVVDGRWADEIEAHGKTKQALAREQQSRAAFQASAATCSESVDALAREGKANREAFQRGLAHSRQQTDTANATAQKILAAGRPAGLDECGAMRKELDDEIARRAASPR